MSIDQPGGYSEWSFDLTPDVSDLFQEALKGQVGVSYEPFAFATQVVAGTNYSFLARMRPVVPDPPLGVARLHVFVPLPGQGAPQVVDIDEIQP